MKLRKLPSVSYYDTSEVVGAAFTYTCAPDFLDDDRRPFWCEFIQMLKSAPVEGYKWIISFQGPLASDSLMPIVIAASDPKCECAYWLADVHKPYPCSTSNFTELSLVCELDTYVSLLSAASIEMRYAFNIGGWLIPENKSTELVPVRKFENGKFAIRRRDAKASFFSSEDFNHIVLVPFDLSFEEALSRVTLLKSP